MTYTKPENVIYPIDKVKDIVIIKDDGEDSYATCIYKYDGIISVGLRWNGNSDGEIGRPQSYGKPYFLILPDEIAIPYLKSLLIDENISKLDNKVLCSIVNCLAEKLKNK